MMFLYDVLHTILNILLYYIMYYYEVLLQACCSLFCSTRTLPFFFCFSWTSLFRFLERLRVLEEPVSKFHAGTWLIAECHPGSGGPWRNTAACSSRWRSSRWKFKAVRTASSVAPLTSTTTSGIRLAQTRSRRSTGSTAERGGAWPRDPCGTRLCE